LAGEGIAKRNLVAEVVINTNTSEVIFKKNLTAESLWRDGIPYDGAAVEVLHTNHKALIAIYSFASFAGLVYTTSASCSLSYLERESECTRFI